MIPRRAVAWTQRAPRPNSVRQRVSVERFSPPAKRAGSHHVARRLQFDLSPPGREPPRRRVRSLSRRARFPSVEVVCIPPEPRRDDLDDEDAERDQLEPHWNSYAAYDLARQTVDISIFRRAHEFAIELKDTLNLNKDPCKNFYEYVCSLWPNRYPVPDDMGHYSVQDYLRDEVAKRIFGGRQHEGLLPLTRVMRGLSLSEWPYELGERLPRARFVLQRLSVDYGLPFFVSLRAVPDPRDARATLLAVDLGEPLLHANFVVSRDADEYRALLNVHATYVRRTMALMGAHDMASTVTADVHDYEFALAEARV
ncbi:hypothetical protein V5799_027560 [Amblyomma americanum]|uniref:Peptidase M13 N-terminal domain-containing protein n=1 Tax=Amblyomma americanum TaxID=6943 RepID=A0AAQ4DFD0_AMBAM